MTELDASIAAGYPSGPLTADRRLTIHEMLEHHATPSPPASAASMSSLFALPTTTPHDEADARLSSHPNLLTEEERDE
jgi:hypothetical protein